MCAKYSLYYIAAYRYLFYEQRFSFNPAFTGFIFTQKSKQPTHPTHEKVFKAISAASATTIEYQIGYIYQRALEK